jgi:hypothetical protein
MKSIAAFLSWLIVLGVLQASPLWNGAQTGMTVAQVKEKFPIATSPKEPTELYGKIVEGLRISPLSYLDEEFLVHFYFDKGSLHQVTLELKNKPAHPSMVKLAERVAADLSKQLGEPKSKKEAKDATGARFEAYWETPKQKASIIVVSSGPIEALYEPISFNINFQTKQE